jgi:hypothetical protein
MGYGRRFRGSVPSVCLQGFCSPSSLSLLRMERSFSVEAKYFSFSVKSEGSDLRLEERRKGFCGVIFLGVQASAWLLATIEEALKASGRGLVKYFREDVKALMV